ncbi:MAG TPA: septum formation initiator family protein [Kineosporiaceae bacterium]
MQTPPGGLHGAVPAAPGRGRPPLVRPVTMLSGVVLVLALLLAPYVRPWVTQRAQLAQGEEQVRKLQKEVDALTAERARWDDPNYVRAQARERLHVVMPGETGLVVLDGGKQPASQADPRSVAAARPAGNQDEVWYTKVWDSIRMAGDPTTEQASAARR